MNNVHSKLKQDLMIFNDSSMMNSYIVTLVVESYYVLYIYKIFFISSHMNMIRAKTETKKLFGDSLIFYLR
jgi:hypothetical protein